MPVSGVTSFTVTRDQVIEAAMRGLSVLEEGANPSATAIQNASFSLNLIIKNWQKDGIKLWTVYDLIIPLTSGITTYSIGPVGTGALITADKPVKLIQSFLRNTSTTPNTDSPMQKISRQEYNMLGSKFSTGVTNSVFFNPGTTTSSVTVFLTPDSSTATNYDLYCTVQRPIFDMVKPSDNFDFPSEWFLGLKWALMAEMASDYDKTLQDRAYYDAKALMYKRELEDWDVEDASVYFIPDNRMNTRGFR